MPIPKPRMGANPESQTDYMARCMHEASKNPDRSNDQNVAICMQAWRDRHKKEEARKELASVLQRAAAFIEKAATFKGKGE